MSNESDSMANLINAEMIRQSVVDMPVEVAQARYAEAQVTALMALTQAVLALVEETRKGRQS